MYTSNEGGEFNVLIAIKGEGIKRQFGETNSDREDRFGLFFFFFFFLLPIASKTVSFVI